MKNASGLALLIATTLLAGARGQAPFHPGAPLGLDEYFPVPEDNPVTPEKIALGRRLFFDDRLSADRSLACASCHKPELAFSDSVAVSPGVGGRKGRRNTPTIINRAYGKSFFWDGRVEALEDQVLRPVQDPNEMNLSLDELIDRLQRDDDYVGQFRRAFGGGRISREHVARALATFVRTQCRRLEGPWVLIVPGPGKSARIAPRIAALGARAISESLHWV